MALPLEYVSIDARKCMPQIRISLRITHMPELAWRVAMAVHLLKLVENILPGAIVEIDIKGRELSGRAAG